MSGPSLRQAGARSFIYGNKSVKSGTPGSALQRTEPETGVGRDSEVPHRVARTGRLAVRERVCLYPAGQPGRMPVPGGRPRHRHVAVLHPRVSGADVSGGSGNRHREGKRIERLIGSKA